MSRPADKLEAIADLYEPPPCDGSGIVHECRGDVASMDGPHASCEEFSCPGCPDCTEEARS